VGGVATQCIFLRTTAVHLPVAISSSEKKKQAPDSAALPVKIQFHFKETKVYQLSVAFCKSRPPKEIAPHLPKISTYVNCVISRLCMN
jgi:hypothetical protein